MGGRVGDQLRPQWCNGLEPFGRSADVIVRDRLEQGYLDSDNGMLFIGPEAELVSGPMQFMGILAVSAAAPEFTVLTGRTELGRVDPGLLTEESPRPSTAVGPPTT